MSPERDVGVARRSIPRRTVTRPRRSGPRLAAALAFGLVMLALFGGSAASAQQATVRPGNWSFSAGSKGNAVRVTVTGLPGGGLGTADVSVAFDAAVLKISACGTGQLAGACNPNAPTGPARAAGFAAVPITAEPVLVATLTVDCVGAAGTSTGLTITVIELTDGTAGSPQPIPNAVAGGAVMCGSASQPTPTAGPSPTPSATLTPTATAMPTPTLTPTPTVVATPALVRTPSPTKSGVATPAATPAPAPTPTPTATPAPTAPPTQTPSLPARGDLNCDGSVDSVDALVILRHVAALPVDLPAGCSSMDQAP